nr:hypothetical protein [Reptile-associated circular DNA molecule]
MRGSCFSAASFMAVNPSAEIIWSLSIGISLNSFKNTIFSFSAFSCFTINCKQALASLVMPFNVLNSCNSSYTSSGTVKLTRFFIRWHIISSFDCILSYRLLCVKEYFGVTPIDRLRLRQACYRSPKSNQ